MFTIANYYYKEQWYSVAINLNSSTINYSTSTANNTHTKLTKQK